MRFKTSTLKEPKHTELVSCVSWMGPDDVVSIGDDAKILKWNLVSAETQPVATLPDGFHPTDMHWFPRSQASGSSSSSGGAGGRGGGKGGGPAGAQELYLVTSAEGKLQLIGKNGRMEKSVEAHR